MIYPALADIQFKESAALIGYLQLETPFAQTNNKGSAYYNGDAVIFEGKKYICAAQGSTVRSPAQFPPLLPLG